MVLGIYIYICVCIYICVYVYIDIYIYNYIYISGDPVNLNLPPLLSRGIDTSHDFCHRPGLFRGRCVRLHLCIAPCNFLFIPYHVKDRSWR